MTERGLDIGITDPGQALAGGAARVDGCQALFGAAMLLIGLYLAYVVIGPHLGRPADLTSLPVFLLFVEVAGFLSEPIANAFSRRQEHEADVYSLEITRGIVPNAAQAAAHAGASAIEHMEQPDDRPLGRTCLARGWDVEVAEEHRHLVGVDRERVDASGREGCDVDARPLKRSGHMRRGCWRHLQF